jgi:hypothetical protein
MILLLEVGGQSCCSRGCADRELVARSAPGRHEAVPAHAIGCPFGEPRGSAGRLWGLAADNADMALAAYRVGVTSLTDGRARRDRNHARPSRLASDRGNASAGATARATNEAREAMLSGSGSSFRVGRRRGLTAGWRGASRLPAIGEQVGQLRRRQRRQAREHVLQIGPRLDAQTMTGRCETEQHRRRPSAFRRADEEPVFPANGDPLHLAFRHVVVDRQEARVGIAAQRGPVIQGIAGSTVSVLIWTPSPTARSRASRIMGTR